MSIILSAQNLSTSFRPLTFSIRSWAAWCPRHDSPADWSVWAASNTTENLFEPARDPLVDFLPLAMRKRLSALTKLCLRVAQDATTEEERSSVRTVFASRHGENRTTFELFSLLGTEASISPFGFSRSVHNTSSGIVSIANRNPAPSTAVGAGADTFLAGVLESVISLGAGPVLLVMADEFLHAAFQRGFPDERPWYYSLGLLFTAGDDFSLSLTDHTVDTTVDRQWEEPQALRFLRWYLGTDSRFSLDGQLQRWNFIRASGERKNA